MGFYSIEWKRSAQKELKKLPRQIISKIVHAIESLAENPQPKHSKKLLATDHTFRIRIGDYRVIYTLHAQKVVIEIIRIGHRKDVYRGLEA